VTPPADPLDFFAQAKARSLHKLDILDSYLRPLTYKLGSICGRGRRYKHIWVVDGFAGAGSYEPDDAGRVQDGSPLIAAKWAKQIAVDRRYELVRCINVERDADCFAQLQRNLAPWPNIADTIRGEFAEKLPEILALIGDDPALFFLDPFGVTGVEMEVIERIAARRGKTELLLHFSDRTFLRMAGHLDDRGDRVPVGQKVAEAKLARLDAHIGTKRWRMLCPPGANTERAIDDVAALYLDQLREHGWRFADQIRMRDRYSDRPAYRLIFATGSPHGVAMMSHIACRFERALRDEEQAGVMTLFQHDEERQHQADLRDRIVATGRAAGTTTSEELAHELTPQLFGLYVSKDYAQAIRDLVDAGLIDRANTRGIKPDEPLRFMDPPQGSLFGLGETR
jgi:three-Cys-motif partner protein